MLPCLADVLCAFQGAAAHLYLHQCIITGMSMPWSHCHCMLRKNMPPSQCHCMLGQNMAAGVHRSVELLNGALRHAAACSVPLPDAAACASSCCSLLRAPMYRIRCIPSPTSSSALSYTTRCRCPVRPTGSVLCPPGRSCCQGAVQHRCND